MFRDDRVTALESHPEGCADGSMEVPRRLDPWVPASLSGMWRDSLLFRYVVQSGERDSDGVGVPADALSLHVRRISSLAGSNARLTLGDRTFENDPGFKLDGSRGRTRTRLPGRSPDSDLFMPSGQSRCGPAG